MLANFAFAVHAETVVAFLAGPFVERELYELVRQLGRSFRYRWRHR